MRAIQRLLKPGCIIVTHPKARLNFELINLFPTFSIKLYPFLSLLGRKMILRVGCIVALYPENAENKETIDFNKSP